MFLAYNTISHDIKNVISSNLPHVFGSGSFAIYSVFNHDFFVKNYIFFGLPFIFTNIIQLSMLKFTDQDKNNIAKYLEEYHKEFYEKELLLFAFSSANISGFSRDYSPIKEFFDDYDIKLEEFVKYSSIDFIKFGFQIPVISTLKRLNIFAKGSDGIILSVLSSAINISTIDNEKHKLLDVQIEELREKLSPVDNLIANVGRTILITNIIGIVYTTFIEKFFKPMQNNWFTEAILNNFLDSFINEYATYSSVNLSSYMCDMETIYSIARIVKKYEILINNDDYLFNILVNINDHTLLDLMNYAIKLVLPNVNIRLIDINHNQKMFSGLVSEANKNIIFRELGNSSVSDYGSIGVFVSILKQLEIFIKQGIKFLTANGIILASLDIRSLTTRTQLDSEDGLDNLFNTNKNLSAFGNKSNKIGLIGVCFSIYDIDDAILSRFSSLVQQNQPFNLFVHHCKKIFLDLLIEFNVSYLFSDANIDQAIVYIARRLIQKTEYFRFAYGKIRQIFELVTTNPAITLNQILKYL